MIAKYHKQCDVNTTREDSLYELSNTRGIKGKTSQMVDWTYMIDMNILISIEERSLQPSVNHRCEATQVGLHGVPWQ